MAETCLNKWNTKAECLIQLFSSLLREQTERKAAHWLDQGRHNGSWFYIPNLLSEDSWKLYSIIIFYIGAKACLTKSASWKVLSLFLFLTLMASTYQSFTQRFKVDLTLVEYKKILGAFSPQLLLLVKSSAQGTRQGVAFLFRWGNQHFILQMEQVSY